MKKSFCFFMMLSLLSVNLIARKNGISLDYNNINRVADLSNQLQYRFMLPNHSEFIYTGTFRKLDDNTWKRHTKQTDMRWLYATPISSKFTSWMYFDYAYQLDKSSFSEGPNYRLHEKRRGIGTALLYSYDKQKFTIDLSYLHNRQNDIQQQDDFYLSNGYANYFEYSFDSSDEENIFNYGMFYRKTDLDFNWRENFGGSLFWGNREDFSAKMNFAKNSSKLYEFQERSDLLNNTVAKTEIYVSKNFFSFINLQLSEEYNYNESDYQEKQNKNFNENELLSALTISYPFFDIIFSHEIRLDLYKKDYLQGERELFKRGKHLNSSFIYYFAQSDSLLYSSTISLEQSFNPENDNYWDNDIAKNLNQFSIFYHYKPPIQLQSHFYYEKYQDVYLSAEMSGRNKIKESYKVQPEIDIDFTKFIQLSQKYLLQADYDDYKYNFVYSDRYFRRFQAEYAVTLGQHKPKFRPLRRYLYFRFLFEYEHNDSGDKIQNYYIKNNESEILSYGFAFNWRYYRVNTFFQPTLVINNTREYQLKGSITYKINTYSDAILRISPTFYEDDNPFWKVEFKYNYNF